MVKFFLLIKLKYYIMFKIFLKKIIYFLIIYMGEKKNF